MASSKSKKRNYEVVGNNPEFPSWGLSWRLRKILRDVDDCEIMVKVKRWIKVELL